MEIYNMLKTAEEEYYKLNDFFVIKEKSKNRLIKIAKDKNFLNQLTNIYPGFGHISKFGDGYGLFYICDKIKNVVIKEYLQQKYNLTLEIGELIEPNINFKIMCDLFIVNVEENS